MKSAKENLQEAIRLIDKYDGNEIYQASLWVTVKSLCKLAVDKLTERSLGASTANSSELYK